MAEEFLKCLVEMTYCIGHTLNIDFLHPGIIFLQLMIFIRTTDANPSKMFVRLSVLFCIEIQSPVIYKANSTEVLSKKYFLFLSWI